MAMGMQSRQFRGSELTELFTAEGFTQVRVHPLWGLYSAVEVVRPWLMSLSSFVTEAAQAGGG
jgi:hypothetical protein